MKVMIPPHGHLCWRTGSCISPPLTRKLLCLFMVTLLTACLKQPNADDIWQNYLSRLGYVLSQDFEIDRPSLATVNKPKPILTQSEVTISVLELANLQQCELGRLIAHRNSSLGKLAVPSQRLVYHLQFIQLAPVCIAKLNEGALKDKLTLALNEKIRNAYQAFTEFLSHDNTLSRILFVNGKSLKLPTMHNGLSETSLALQSLLQIKHKVMTRDWHAIDVAEIEQSLALLHSSTLINQYIYSLIVYQNYINETNNTLEPLIDDAKCQSKRNNQRVEILLNVFNKYFLTDIQTYGSQLRTIQFELGVTIEDLFTDTHYASMLHHAFNDDIGTLAQQNLIAIKRHVAWWKQVVESCGETRTLVR